MKSSIFSLILASLLSALFCGCGRSPESLPHSPSLQGEGWESSGGSGVACFDSEETAHEGDVVLARDGALTQSLRGKVASLVTLELWESKGKLHFVQAAGMDRASLLNRLRDRFRKYSPIFFSRLEMVESRVGFSRWKENDHIPRIDDAHPAIDVAKTDPKCRLVQLARRFSRSRKGYLPQSSVEVDQWLFDHKLDALNQAILIFHEQLYLIGKELVHRHSDDLRPVVAYYYSDEISDRLNAFEAREREAKAQQRRLLDENTPSRVIQDPIATVLGDYYLYFTSDPLDRPEATPPAPGQYSRYVAFGTLLAKLRERKGKCLDEAHYADDLPSEKRAEIQQACSFSSADPRTLPEVIGDEEAFLFLGRWVLDRVRVIESSENLVVWDHAHPEAITALQLRELKQACDAIRSGKLPVIAWFDRAIKMAAAYCNRASPR